MATLMIPLYDGYLYTALAGALAALEALPVPEVAVGAIIAVTAHCSTVLAFENALAVGASLSISCFSLATHIFRFLLFCVLLV
jgi:hypothetical protein